MFDFRYKSDRALQKIMPRSLQSLYWKYRHLWNPSWPEAYMAEQNINHPHRKLVIEAVGSFTNFESVSEIGCASGPNLLRLHQIYPNKKYFGYDINSKAVNAGVRNLKNKNITNISLKVLDTLSGVPETSDIILSDASLLYCPPQKLQSTIEKLWNAANLGLVLVEQESPDSNSHWNGAWQHPFSSIIQRIAPEATIESQKIDESCWSGNWVKFGRILIVRKHPCAKET